MTIDASEVRTVSETGGEKGTKLARFDLIPAMPLRELAELFGAGAKKYAERNWERGYEWSKSYGALQRHLNSFWQGEDWDEETSDLAGKPIHHLTNVAWHAMAMRQFYANNPTFDDRPSGLAVPAKTVAKLVDIKDYIYDPVQGYWVHSPKS